MREPSEIEFSKAGLDVQERFEGCNLTAYPDPASALGRALKANGLWQAVLGGAPVPGDYAGLSGDPWTIGYGHTGPDVHEGLAWTQEQCDAQVLLDDAHAIADVRRLMKVPLTQGEFDALVDFAYNCGGMNLAHSTLLRLLNQGLYDKAADQFECWDKANGQVMAGLLRRRQAEEQEFKS
jgi:lysozyme